MSTSLNPAMYPCRTLCFQQKSVRAAGEQITFGPGEPVGVVQRRPGTGAGCEYHRHGGCQGFERGDEAFGYMPCAEPGDYEPVDAPVEAAQQCAVVIESDGGDGEAYVVCGFCRVRRGGGCGG